MALLSQNAFIKIILINGVILQEKKVLLINALIDLPY